MSEKHLFECVQKAAKSWLVDTLLKKIIKHRKLPIDADSLRPETPFPHKLQEALLDGFQGSQETERAFLAEILQEMERRFRARIIGQDELVRTILISLVLNEHALLEGLPGVGKTEMIKWVAQVTGLPFSRVQFIPDMLPSDLIGKDKIDIVKLHNREQGAVSWVNGPIFGTIVLADEINRAPSKVQAALLEAMGERQVTPFGDLSRPVLSPLHEAALRVWVETDGYRNRGLLGVREPIPVSRRGLKLCSQFTVFATMNPIEQEGTYPLSEAQTDRFCFKVVVPYPSRDYYNEILEVACPQEPLEAIEVNQPVEQCITYFRQNPHHMLFVLLPAYFFLLCRAHIVPVRLLKTNTSGAAEKPEYEWDSGRKSMYEDMRDSPKFSNSDRLLTTMLDIVCMTTARSLPSGEGVGSAGQYDTVQLELRKYIADLTRSAGSPSQSPAPSGNGHAKQRQERMSSILEEPHCQYVKAGAGPRGFLKMIPAALCHAMLRNSSDVSEEDIRFVAASVLRHRVHMDVHARLAGITADDVVHRICQVLLEQSALR